MYAEFRHGVQPEPLAPKQHHLGIAPESFPDEREAKLLRRQSNRGMRELARVVRKVLHHEEIPCHLLNRHALDQWAQALPAPRMARPILGRIKVVEWVRLRLKTERAIDGRSETRPSMHGSIRLAEARIQVQKHHGSVRRADKGLRQQIELELKIRPGAPVELFDCRRVFGEQVRRLLRESGPGVRKNEAFSGSGRVHLLRQAPSETVQGSDRMQRDRCWRSARPIRSVAVSNG